MAPNFDSDLLVLIAAGGKQVAQLLPHVTKQWKQIRLVVNTDSSAQRLRSRYPDAEVVTAELTEPSQCLRVVQSATTIYHIGPSHHPREITIGYNMIDAALIASSSSAKPIHFVYSSVLNSQLRKLMNHDCKRHIEEYLIESGLDYTILSPTILMDNFQIPTVLKEAKEKKPDEELAYPMNWNPETKFSFIALQDLGLAAAIVLREREKHFLARYDLCATLPQSFSSLCQEAGEVLGRKLVPKQNGFEEAVEERIRLRHGDDIHPLTRDATERLFLYYNRHGLQGSPNILEWLMGRKPTTFKSWVEEKVNASR